MPSDLHVALARMATARAHLLGAASSRLWREGNTIAAAAARRRYWRELGNAARLAGMPWPEAEAMGEER